MQGMMYARCLQGAAGASTCPECKVEWVVVGDVASAASQRLCVLS